MEKGKMSIEEVLNITVNILNAISVPVLLKDSVSEPISQAVGNLNACLEALQKAAEQEEGSKNEPDADAE